MTDRPGYLWDNTLAEEKARLDAQAAIWDAHTRRYLEALGVGPGWRCLEIGAGSGTITSWLAERVAPGGSVVATDIDVRFLGWIDSPQVEIRELDITSGSVEADAYDLVYARMVLMHLPDADTHVKTMLRAVRPGGLILLQDVDLAYLQTTPSRQFTWPTSNQRFGVRMIKALNGLLALTGASADTAQEHPHRLLRLGLEDVGAEAVNRMQRGDPTGTYTAAFERVAPYLVQYAGVSEEDTAKRLAQLADPAQAFSTGIMMSAWGRRPVA